MGSDSQPRRREPASAAAETYRARPWLAWYPPGVPADIEIPEGSLIDLLDESVRRFGPSPALQFFGRVTDYTAVGSRVARAAETLRRTGVAAGDRVALMLPNCPQHVIAFYAILRLGAIAVEHNPLYTTPELERQFRDHGARVAIVWDKAAAAVAAIARAPETLFTVDLTTEMPLRTRLALRLPLARARDARAQVTTDAAVPGARSWDRAARGPALDPGTPRPTADATAIVQYTSGTTGVPKGAVLSHRNLMVNAAQGRAWMPSMRPGEETVYAVLPLFHAYGLTLCMTYAMSVGARLVLFPRFDVDLVLDAMGRMPATFLPAVPPIYDRLVVGAARRGVDLSTIRIGISGAMSLPPATVKTWEQVTGGLLVEGYGMTETSPVAIGNPIGPARRPGTMGIPFPNTEIRVVDPEDISRDLPAGEAGELLIRGPQVFAGYWNRPEETALALTADGWLRTGDIVSMAPDGFVTFADRIKELIVTGGFKVAPTEVEEQLMLHPDIAGVAAVGIPSASGEDVVAAVVLRPGAVFDPDALREFCRTRLTSYKIPRRFIQADDLPRSILGKVLRRQVRDRILAQP